MAIFTLQSGPANARFMISRWILLGGVALLLGPWVIVGGWVLVNLQQKDAAARAAAVATGPDVVKCAPGPWGNLEFSRILIEPPEEFIVADYTRPETLAWHFKGYTAEKLREVLTSTGLDDAQRRYLDAPDHREVFADRIVIHPDRDFVIALKPEQRAKLYAVLSEFEENTSQVNPFRMRPESVSEWFTDSGLPAETTALARRLLYQRTPTAICFADDDIILPSLNPFDRVKFIKTLSRKSTLTLQLSVPHNADVETLAAYWGRGRHKKDIKPLLQSIARRPAGGSVDVVHLFPAFPRSLIYTYPLPPLKPGDDSHDCHWTSLNFFNEVPDERFANIANVQQTLLNDYYVAPGLPAFGDILVFMRPDGVVVHSCVYIADNIVFTKNGPAFSVPWQLATLDGVMTFYSVGAPIHIQRYRSKNS